MKNLWLIVVLLMVGTTVSFGAKADKAYTGEIMDSTCAKMGNHDAGYKMSNTHTPKDCTLACVKSGSKFVLYNSATKTAYQLDDQNKPKEFAGQKVKVIGCYNTGTKTIHVEKIEAGS